MQETQREAKNSPQLSLGRKSASVLIKILTFPIFVLMRFLYLLQQLLNWIRFRYVEFIIDPDDIFIVTYPRSGTTWLQMILHQLTSDGELDFTHISERIPWFERYLRYEESIHELQCPRIFKSHLSYSGFKSVPKGNCRYIYVIRDVSDVLVSYYHFYISHLGYKGSFEQFFELFIRGKVRYGSWFSHVNDWARHVDNVNIYIVHYEDLKENLEGEIRSLAEFCGIPIQEERMPEIINRCGFEYMKQHQKKFDYVTEILFEAGIESESFIRSGKVGESESYLNKSQKQILKQEYSELPDNIQTLVGWNQVGWYEDTRKEEISEIPLEGEVKVPYHE